MNPITSYKKKQLKILYSKSKYRGLHLFEDEGRRVGCVVKDIKGKKIIYKAIKDTQLSVPYI